MNSLRSTLEALAVFPDQLERLFGEFPIKQRGWRPADWTGIPSERLTATEQVCHLRDIELEGYAVRFRRTLSEDNPVLPDLPGELMASERDYANSDPLEALRAFAAARANTVKAIQAYTALELSRAATFEERPTTLRGLVHFLSSHDHQHLAGLQWLLARLEGALDGQLR